MFKKSVLILIAVVLMCTLAACDSSGNEPVTEEITTEETTTQKITEPPEETTSAVTTSQQPTSAPVYNAETEKVWATADVNIRQEPNTSCTILGKLHQGNSIMRISKGDDGWSKVLYGDTECYIHSDYLTTTEPEKVASDRFVIDPYDEDWSLLLVNTEREIPGDYQPKLAEVASSGIYMDYRVAPYYNDMYEAAKADGITLTPYSGYRSYARQERNYNNLTDTYMSRYGISRQEAAKKAATVILPPGTSEHNLGFAMDVCNTNDSFKNQEEYKWLTEHAHEYGFILRYTAEKQPITGIIPEPWHWRFVGVEHAEKIKNSGLCLEEYLIEIGKIN